MLAWLPYQLFQLQKLLFLMVVDMVEEEEVEEVEDQGQDPEELEVVPRTTQTRRWTTCLTVFVRFSLLAMTNERWWQRYMGFIFP